MKTLIYTILLIHFIIIDSYSQHTNSLKLWYDNPAKDWMTEALPFGNGYIGAMFFGSIDKEQIQFSEGSLWSGGPDSGTDYNYGIREGAWNHLSEIRLLLAEGKFEEAHLLAKKKLTGKIHNQNKTSMFGDYGAQQTMGDIFISVSHSGKPTNYRRELNLNNAEGKVSYEIDENNYTRTYFGSFPAKTLVYRLESSCLTDYTINFKTPHDKVKERFQNNIYYCQGKVSDNNMKFETFMKIETDGDINFSNGFIKISNAKDLIIYHGAATDYIQEFPHYKGNNYQINNKVTIENLSEKSYDEVRKQHLTDYQNLFSRVELKLNENTPNELTTDKRLIEYANGNMDFGLEELYFQYSRYLMISSSRPTTMPMHLQGKWNNSTNPPWACDYHMNINQQMLYWPAEVTNLGECHLPLFLHIESLVKPGKIAAKEFFNSNGWIVNTMNNAFGFTSPGWDFPWGFFPGGAAWLCQHLWEHYEFNRDKTFLKTTAYPIMKEAALFWIDYLTMDRDGFLVSCPSYSPEHGGISKGASMDHQIAWDILNNCISACETLNIDIEFKEKAEEVRDKILPPKIGNWGQLQEWKEDVDDPESKHRHVSHLYALHPGKQITVENTPDLAEAAKTSLIARGDGGTGWSLAWKVNFWARLKDGEKAYQLLKRLLRPTNTHGTEMSDGGGSYINLLCAHPPYQLDGNMGGCAGIAEMLIQSHTGVIELLPAIPNYWESGYVKGLKARGNFTIDIKWEQGKLNEVKISGSNGERGLLKYEHNIKEFILPDSGVLTLSI